MTTKRFQKKNMLGLVLCAILSACQNGVEEDRYTARPFNQDNVWVNEKNPNHRFVFNGNFPTGTNKATFGGLEYLPSVPDSLAGIFTGFYLNRNITFVVDRQTGTVTYKGRYFQDSLGGVTFVLNLGTLILR
jgi:hypothetical protein